MSGVLTQDGSARFHKTQAFIQYREQIRIDDSVDKDDIMMISRRRYLENAKVIAKCKNKVFNKIL